MSSLRTVCSKSKIKIKYQQLNGLLTIGEPNGTKPVTHHIISNKEL